jgi:hypothetical protein
VLDLTILLIIAIWRQFYIKLDALEHSDRHELENKSPNELTSTNTQTDSILLQVQGISLDESTTDFNQHHLDCNGRQKDDDEPFVVEEV